MHPPPTPGAFSGKYITGDINEAYLRNLEESGRGRRARPGKLASLIDVPGAGGGGKKPAATAA